VDFHFLHKVIYCRIIKKLKYIHNVLDSSRALICELSNCLSSSPAELLLGVSSRCRLLNKLSGPNLDKNRSSTAFICELSNCLSSSPAELLLGVSSRCRLLNKLSGPNLDKLQNQPIRACEHSSLVELCYAIFPIKYHTVFETQV
jgi:hypothetical protein